MQWAQRLPGVSSTLESVSHLIWRKRTMSVGMGSRGHRVHEFPAPQICPQATQGQQKRTQSSQAPSPSCQFTQAATFQWQTKVARPGFEPGQTEPKSVVLPLHYRAPLCVGRNLSHGCDCWQGSDGNSLAVSDVTSIRGLDRRGKCGEGGPGRRARRFRKEGPETNRLWQQDSRAFEGRQPDSRRFCPTIR
jgi:hypothetical protein